MIKFLQYSDISCSHSDEERDSTGTQPQPMLVSHIYQHLMMAAHQHFPANLMELERIFQEEWDQLCKSKLRTIWKNNQDNSELKHCCRALYKLLNQYYLNQM